MQKIITQTRNRVKNNESERKGKSPNQKNFILIPDSLQLYNVWNFQGGDKQYGRYFESAIPGQIVENVLYYYTEPLDTVVDLMAGGGTTIDVCQVMNRKCLAYDKNPIRSDIVKHDLINGFPEETRDSHLIFLDPPYFDIIDGIQDFKDYNLNFATYG